MGLQRSPPITTWDSAEAYLPPRIFAGYSKTYMRQATAEYIASNMTSDPPVARAAILHPTLDPRPPSHASIPTRTLVSS